LWWYSNGWLGLLGSLMVSILLMMIEWLLVGWMLVVWYFSVDSDWLSSVILVDGL